MYNSIFESASNMVSVLFFLWKNNLNALEQISFLCGERKQSVKGKMNYHFTNYLVNYLAKISAKTPSSKAQESLEKKWKVNRKKLEKKEEW